ncbi:hypothetical protein JT180_00820, partial [Helicobacter pylori]|nr:hypothetical protein [Helicobacter pylori]
MSQILGGVFLTRELITTIKSNQWDKVEKTLKDLSVYQQEHAKNLYLSSSKVDSEIFLNHTNF